MAGRDASSDSFAASSESRRQDRACPTLSLARPLVLTVKRIDRLPASVDDPRSGNTPCALENVELGLLLEEPISLSVSVDLVLFGGLAIIFSETYSIQAWFSGGLPYFLPKLA